MKHKGSLDISRVGSSSRDEDYIIIRLKDDDACVGLFEIELSLDKFAEALTGVARTKCTFEVYSVEKAGLKRESLPVEFPVPLPPTGDKIKYAKENVFRYTPEGWTPSIYFHSQNSFFFDDGECYARTTAYRWVEKQEEE